LRPTPKHAPVARFVPPETFAEYERVGREIGFEFVAAGPLVRSSYHAAEGFVAARGRPVREPRRADGDPQRSESAWVLGAEPNADATLIPAARLARRS
jgi:hypothetical protein